jgi:hypothetical protein
LSSDWEEVKATLDKANFIMNDLFPIAAASYLSREWEGEPLWIMGIAPAGSGKTATVDQFSELEEMNNAVIVSSITPAALISGYGGEGMDPSLMARLHNKLLVAKDFGTILSMGSNQVNEIFGLLREAFDGSVRKTFGHLERVYDPIHFNFIALTTEACHKVAPFNQQLGERFLKFEVTPPTIPSPPPKINPAIKSHIAEWLMAKEKETIPKLSDDDYGWIGTVAKTTAVLRTSVIHEGYSKEVKEIPGFEGSARLEKQLNKLYTALMTITDGDKCLVRRLCKHAAKSSVAPRKRKMIKYILRCNQDGEEGPPEEVDLPKYPRITDVAEYTRHGYQLTRRMLRDLYVLKLLERKDFGFPKTFLWEISDTVKGNDGAPMFGGKFKKALELYFREAGNV